jgi:hypothetical protein
MKSALRSRTGIGSGSGSRPYVYGRNETSVIGLLPGV